MKKAIPHLITALLIVSIGGFTGICHAQKTKSGVKKLLQHRNKQIKEIVGPKGSSYTDGQREKLKKVINDVIDYRAMAKFALQDTWDKISSDQRNEFVDLFSTIISDHSINNLDIYRASIRYLNIAVDGNDAHVNTLATEQDVRKHVDYKLHYNTQKKQWFVTDFSIDNVSTAKSYRRQFQDIISKDGFQNLMQTLRKRADKT